MSAQTRILIVDDDEATLTLLKDILSQESWAVYTAIDGSEAITIAALVCPTLTILDLNLPRVNGFEVCRCIIKNLGLPVMIVSGRNDPLDKTLCFNMGVQDYLEKPFNSEELSARVKAVVERFTTMVPVLPTIAEGIFISGNLRINFNTREVTMSNHEINLTKIEFDILEQLVRDPGKVLTYCSLLKKVWGDQYVVEREYLHVHVGHLKKKLQYYDKDREYIVSTRGIGYRFFMQGHQDG